MGLMVPLLVEISAVVTQSGPLPKATNNQSSKPPSQLAPSQQHQEEDRQRSDAAMRCNAAGGSTASVQSTVRGESVVTQPDI